MNSAPVRPHPAKGPGEQGSVLVIALVFLVLAGVLVAALVAQSTPSLVTTAVVLNLNDSVAAADAGVEYGIQTLRNDSTLCAGPSTKPTSLPDMLPPVNNHRADVTCQTMQGYAAGAFGWAVITNDPGDWSINGESAGMSINGPVFNGGGWSLDRPLSVNDGNAYTVGFPCDNPTNLTVAPTPPFSEQCGTNPPPDPKPALPTAVPGKASLPTVTGGCTTLYPGYYTTAGQGGQQLPPLTGDVYMASGVYYFKNVGTLNVGKTLFGGQPAPGETQLTTAAACRADPTGNGTDGRGVEIILGGDTSIVVGPGSTMELYTRTPASADGSTPGVTLYQVPFETQAPWDPTSAPPPMAPFLAMGALAYVAVHGGVYGPSGSVSLYANSSSPVLTGGADVYRLFLQSSGGATGPIISVGATPGGRHTVITATTDGGSGQNIVARAVVEIANDAARTVTIDSWRTRHDCPDPAAPCT
jgi:hypothetical protein